MAPTKKVVGLIKLQLKAGEANPAPPVGPGRAPRRPGRAGRQPGLSASAAHCAAQRPREQCARGRTQPVSASG